MRSGTILLVFTEPFFLKEQMMIIVLPSRNFDITVILPVVGEITGGSIHLKESATIDLTMDVVPSPAHDATTDDVCYDQR